MKSRKKVISQKHIREIPSTFGSFRSPGILSHGFAQPSTRKNKIKRRLQKQSRSMNRP